MNIIMRVAWNRPEMLQISIEHEIEARKYYMPEEDFKTLFVVDYGAPKRIFKVIEEYPFEKEMIVRGRRYGLTPNILEGMKNAFNMTDDYIMYIEDDICVHHSYFKYMSVLLDLLKEEDTKFSVLLGYNFDNEGSVNEVYKRNHYCAWASLIDKEFYSNYIHPCSNDGYYGNQPGFATTLNNKYKEHWKSNGGIYRYKDTTHYAQAGIINRLIDVSIIEKDIWSYLPRVNRQFHIGFYGLHRPGAYIPGKTYKERLKNMRYIIGDNLFYELTATKQYDDYLLLDPRLDDWDGTLVINE